MHPSIFKRLAGLPTLVATELSDADRRRARELHAALQRKGSTAGAAMGRAAAARASGAAPRMSAPPVDEPPRQRHRATRLQRQLLHRFLRVEGLILRFAAALSLPFLERDDMLMDDTLQEILRELKQRFALASAMGDIGWMEKLGAVLQLRQLVSLSPAPLADVFAVEGLPKQLLTMLATEDEVLMQIETAWVLTNLASGSKAQTKTLRQLAFIPVFVHKLKLAQTQDPELVLQLLWGLGQWYNSMHTGSFSLAGTIHVPCTYAVGLIRRVVCLVLTHRAGNQTSDGKEGRDAVLAAGALQHILPRCAPNDNPEHARVAAWLLHNLLQQPTPPVEIREQVLRALLPLLLYRTSGASAPTDDPETLGDALAGCIAAADKDVTCSRVVADHPGILERLVALASRAGSDSSDTIASSASSSTATTSGSSSGSSKSKSSKDDAPALALRLLGGLIAELPHVDCEKIMQAGAQDVLMRLATTDSPSMTPHPSAQRLSAQSSACWCIANLLTYREFIGGFMDAGVLDVLVPLVLRRGSGKCGDEDQEAVAAMTDDEKHSWFEAEKEALYALTYIVSDGEIEHVRALLKRPVLTALVRGGCQDHLGSPPSPSTSDEDEDEDEEDGDASDANSDDDAGSRRKRSDAVSLSEACLDAIAILYRRGFAAEVDASPWSPRDLATWPENGLKCPRGDYVRTMLRSVAELRCNCGKTGRMHWAGPAIARRILRESHGIDIEDEEHDEWEDEELEYDGEADVETEEDTTTEETKEPSTNSGSNEVSSANIATAAAAALVAALQDKEAKDAASEASEPKKPSPAETKAEATTPAPAAAVAAEEKKKGTEKATGGNGKS